MVKILSHITLSALLLISTAGMTINMHYCQDQLYDLAINSPAHDCCESNMNDNACRHDHDMAKSHHCDDESIKIEASHDFLVSGLSFNFENSHSFELFSTSKLMLKYPDIETLVATRILNYKKPPPQEVILAEIQSFLI